MENDPLAKFISNDINAANRKKLADFLTIFLGKIDPNTGEFEFLPAFYSLAGNIEKIEISLVAAKARALITKNPDGMLPSELIALDIMPVGSTKTAIRTLCEDKKIKKESGGRYIIPNYRIDDLISTYNEKNTK